MDWQPSTVQRASYRSILVLIAGGLAPCRIGSKHLALQIKAIEEGLLPRGA
jgi:hypothetical protein